MDKTNVIEIEVDPRISSFKDKVLDLDDEHIRTGRITYETAAGVMERIKLEILLESME